jgi:hypothetical protein
MTKWVVWSEEHGAWWGPGRHGYTTSLAKAGRYDRDEARVIAAEANRYCAAGTFHEVALPDPLTAAPNRAIRVGRPGRQ